MAHDVFISHSTEDKGVADAICAALEAAEIRCWVAPRDIPPAAEWATSIVSALGASPVMVLVFSEDSSNSNHVRRELTVAAEAGVVIVPLKIDDTPLEGLMEYYLANTHWLDAMNPPTKAQIAELVDTVRAIVAAKGGGAPGLVREEAELPAPPSPAPPSPTPKRTKRLVAAVAALAIVAGGVALWSVLRSTHEPGTRNQAAGSVSATQGPTIETGKLLVGVEPTYPPFQWIPGVALDGFDIDIVRAIAERLDLAVDFKILEWGEPVPQLMAQQVDFIVGGWTIPEAGLEDVVFSDAYFDVPQGVLVLADSDVDSLDDLNEGDVIAVDAGTGGDYSTESKLAARGVVVERYADWVKAAEAVADKKARAALMDWAVALYINDYLDEPKDFDVIDKIWTGEEYGLCFRQDRAALAEAVNAALAEIRADGTYNRIYRKWFMEDAPAEP